MVRRLSTKHNESREYVLSLGKGVNLVIPENMVVLRNKCLQEMLALSEDTIPESIVKCGECPWNDVKIGNNPLCTYPELDQLGLINMKNGAEINQDLVDVNCNEINIYKNEKKHVCDEDTKQWTCECGQVNTGNYCQNCGKEKQCK